MPDHYQFSIPIGWDDHARKLTFAEHCGAVSEARENDSMITVKHLAGDEWQVTVKAGVTTQHRVRVTASDLDRFAEARTTEELLRESFRFLLEREPNTAILDSFDLPIIGRYFPEYEWEIRKRLRGAN